MKKIFTVIFAVGLVFTGSAQRLVIGERAPELRGVADDHLPTWIVFVHPQNSQTPAVLTYAQSLTRTLADEDVEVGLTIVTDNKVFAEFGLQYVPFSILVDKKHRILWMGNPMQLNSEIISKLCPN